jgi:hypothetical protein
MLCTKIALHVLTHAGLPVVYRLLRGSLFTRDEGLHDFTRVLVSRVQYNMIQNCLKLHEIICSIKSFLFEKFRLILQNCLKSYWFSSDILLVPQPDINVGCNGHTIPPLFHWQIEMDDTKTLTGYDITFLDVYRLCYIEIRITYHKFPTFIIIWNTKETNERISNHPHECYTLLS